jgi:hypothetical protein
MNKVGTAFIAAATLFAAVSAPAFASRQYAVKQTKILSIEGVRGHQNHVTRESDADVTKIANTGKSADYSFHLRSRESPDLKAAWVIELPGPRATNNLSFKLVKEKDGIFFKDTTDPIVRVQFSSKNNSTLRFSTIPHRDTTMKDGRMHVVFHPVDNANPIIHKVAVVAVQDDTKGFIKSHANFKVSDLEIDKKNVEVSGTYLTPIVDNSDPLVDGATHID